MTAGNAVHKAANLVKARILRIAETVLEAAASDLELADGKVRVRGVPQRAVTLAEIAHAAAAEVLPKGPPGTGFLPRHPISRRRPRLMPAPRMRPSSRSTPRPARSWSSATWWSTIPGRLINPLLAEGQVAGGVAQGLGTALSEEFVYDARGQPLSGSLADYALPIAASVPAVECEHIETLSTRNPLGVKGLGEGGAIGSPAAIANAVEDALRRLGVVVRGVPLTPARIRDLIAASAR